MKEETEHERFLRRVEQRYAVHESAEPFKVIKQAEVVRSSFTAPSLSEKSQEFQGGNREQRRHAALSKGRSKE